MIVSTHTRQMPYDESTNVTVLLPLSSAHNDLVTSCYLTSCAEQVATLQICLIISVLYSPQHCAHYSTAKSHTMVPQDKADRPTRTVCVFDIFETDHVTN